MSEPSNWTLSNTAQRILIPKAVLVELENNAISRDCFPTAFGYYPSAYRHKMRRHFHDDFLMMYCAGGEGTLRLDNVTYDLSSGDFVILPPGLAHDYAASDMRPWSLFWCHFQGQQAQTFFDYIGLERDKPIIHKLNDENLQASFFALMSISQSGYSDSAFIHAANQLRQILTLVERLKKRAIRRETTDRLQAVRAFMRANLSKKLSLEELAEVSRLSKYHFTRKYRELTGYAPLQHFEHLKVEQACLQLENSTQSISEIAFNLGYDDPLYFSRVFKKVTGKSPSQYRTEWISQ